jgi:hypothetical protein
LKSFIKHLSYQTIFYFYSALDEAIRDLATNMAGSVFEYCQHKKILTQERSWLPKRSKLNTSTSCIEVSQNYDASVFDNRFKTEKFNELAESFQDPSEFLAFLEAHCNALRNKHQIEKK